MWGGGTSSQAEWPCWGWHPQLYFGEWAAHRAWVSSHLQRWSGVSMGHPGCEGATHCRVGRGPHRLLAINVVPGKWGGIF